METIIRFDNVSKRYDLGLTRTSLPSMLSNRVRQVLRQATNHNSKPSHLWAVKEVSFDLNRGQSLALVGPNGAGKSTILKLLSKITYPSSGNININGRLSALIELGAGFHPDLTGRENVYLNGRILGLNRKEIDDRFDEIVDFSGLDLFMDTPVKRYSSGMAVRLGFAVASCIEPDILLVDEVLAVGDAAFRQKCISRIRSLLQNNTSLIFVSHNLELVKAICESALYIDGGKVKYRGTSTDVIAKYNHDLDEKRASELSHASRDHEASSIDVEITKIKVSAVGGESESYFYNDLPAEICIHYFARRDLGAANMVVRIYRSDGVSCCIVRTFLDGYPISINRGYGTVSLVLDPLQLFGGLYYATAWLMDDTDTAGLVNGSSDWFEVKNRVQGLPNLDGVFEPKRKWQQMHMERAESISSHVERQTIIEPTDNHIARESQ